MLLGRAYLQPLLILATCVGLLAVMFPAIHFHDSEFDAFLHTYHKKYSSKADYDSRLAVFHENLKLISEYNTNHTETVLAINEFGDLTQDEFRRGYLSPLKDELTFEVCMQGDTAPEEVDWTKAGVVGDVVHQGNSGSSVPFVVAASLESAFFLKTHSRLPLSVQQLLDCVGPLGTYDDYFSYIVRIGGLLPTHVYRSPKQCEAEIENWGGVKVTGYQDSPRGDQLQMMLALASQPLAVAVEADEIVFQFYSSGVIASNCGENVDHAVLLVGYGVTPSGQRYWKIQNTWGVSWGQNGYALILRQDEDRNEGEGVCGIADIATYPLLG